MSSCVIYAGTFDPITYGHLDIIERAARLFSKLVVAVADNPSKNPLFSLNERAYFVQHSTQHLPNVEVVNFSGLLVDLAKQYQAISLIRGIRSADDVEYEIQLAQLNNQLAGQLETVILPPAVQWRYLSSTMVREIFRHHGNVAPFVPPVVYQALQAVKNH